jgi:hypothetical protein
LPKKIFFCVIFRFFYCVSIRDTTNSTEKIRGIYTVG